MKKLISATLVATLCLLAFGAPSCDQDKPRDVRLAEIGRDINLGLNEGVRFLRSSHQSGLIADAPYAHSLRAIKKIQTSADYANRELDAIATLDLTNKAAIITALDGIARAVQEALNDPQITSLPPEVAQRIRMRLAAFSLSLSVAKTIVAAIDKPTPKANIVFQIQGVK